MTDFSQLSDQDLLTAFNEARGFPSGTTPRSDYGARAYETKDGTILAQGPNGGMQVLKGPRATASAETRSRLALALGPAISAQQNLEAEETAGNGERVNPFNRDWGARALDSIPDWGAFSPLARAWGGQDYQNYEQAARTVESSLLPIFSGAAVTESEAKRFLRANQPQMGDTAETLRRKSVNRQMMINGAAEIMGEDLPFPQAGSWKGAAKPQAKAAPAQPQLSAQQNALLGLATGQVSRMGVQPAPRQAQAAPRAGQVVDGYRFKGGDPSKQSNWVRQ